jgi:hypothetical protein
MIAGGMLLFVIGIVHDVVGLAGLRRAVDRGQIAERLAAGQIVNWLVSGATISLLGVLAVMAAWQMDSAGRLARGIIALIGAFFVCVGFVAFAFQPHPAVFVFTGLGLMLCVPLAAGRPRS